MGQELCLRRTRRVKDVGRLTGKQHAFVIAYLKNGFNATEAARTAGYKGNDHTLEVVGYENLRKPEIKKRIEAHFEEKETRKLTGKQEAFVIAYLKNGFNATEAARTAGYKGNENTLAVIGYQNLRKHKILERIEAYFEEKGMAANEVLFRLSEQARSDITFFIDAPTKRQFKLNMEKIKAKGYLIRKIKYTLQGPEIELYSSQKALELIGKHHRLFVDRVEHDGEICLIFDAPVPAGAMEEIAVEPEDPPIKHRRLPG